MSRLTIAVSGSRTLRSRDLIWPLLDEMAVYYTCLGYDLHWHFGEAQGVDALALLWARDRGLTPRTIFFANLSLFCNFDLQAGEQAVAAADWDAQGLSAGPIRNAAMLSGEGCSLLGCKGVDVLFAIRDGRPGKSRGTDNCREQAKARKIAAQTYTVEEGVAGEWLDQ